MATGGYSSDTATRKSSRRLNQAGVLAFNFFDGNAGLYHPGTEHDYEVAKKAGKLRTVAAEDLGQCHLTEADEITGHVVVEFKDVSTQ